MRSPGTASVPSPMWPRLLPSRSHELSPAGDGVNCCCIVARLRRPLFSDHATAVFYISKEHFLLGAVLTPTSD